MGPPPKAGHSTPTSQAGHVSEYMEKETKTDRYLFWMANLARAYFIVMSALSALGSLIEFAYIFIQKCIVHAIYFVFLLIVAILLLVIAAWFDGYMVKKRGPK